MSPFFVTFQKWVQYSQIVLFARNVKKIKGAPRKNGAFDGTCKWDF